MSQNYDYDVAELCRQHVSRDGAINYLMEEILSGRIDFPYHRYFMETAATIFGRLPTADLPVVHKSYRLYSYYPIHGCFLPPQFRGQPTYIEMVKGMYKSVDILSDLYIEDIRLQARRSDQEHSVLGCWRDPTKLREILSEEIFIPDQKRITAEILREAVYHKVAETKIFNPSWAVTLLRLVLGTDLAGKKWLDISSGWGDRLLSAMALNMDYTGYDPNSNLEPGHSRMIADFGDKDRHRVIYSPFETASIEGKYDVVLTSPPYYTVEEYVPDQEGQSIVSYPNFEDWMACFLFRALTKAWDALKPEGYLILHLGDSKTVKTCEATNLFIENFLLQASWEGIIGVQGMLGYPRPVWVWKKTTHVKRWIPRRPGNLHDRSLYRLYPQLYRALVQRDTIAVNPNYQLRKNNAQTIRLHVAERLPRANVRDIEYILDDLMISSLLERSTVESTIDTCVHMVEQA